MTPTGASISQHGAPGTPQDGLKEHQFAPKLAATPSGAYTASELDAITRAEQRDALAQAKAEESKSFMEKLGFTCF